jgi:uroporphyrin-III C-methyltransferase
LSRPLFLSAVALLVLALLLSLGLWIKLSDIQEQLARQSADSSAAALEAKANAKAAQELARDTAARQALMETRLSEVALQRSQLEALMQSLSRSRDENLVVDIESALRLAQQQAQLTGSIEPLLAALKTGEQRIARAAQPRLSHLQRALAKDAERMKNASVTDVPSLLQKLDELVRQVDDLSLANQYKSPTKKTQDASSDPADAGTKTGSSKDEQKTPKNQEQNSWTKFWQQWVKPNAQAGLDELRGLVRVSRIEQAEAVLLTPEHSFFIRENIKLKLLNARLALLSRQFEVAKLDCKDVSLALARYFDPGQRSTQTAQNLLQLVQQQMKNTQLPRMDDTLTALATAAR